MDPEIEKQKGKAYRQGRVAYAGHNEGFLCRRSIGRIRVPKTYQQIATEADAFPRQIKKQQIIRQDQNQHRGNKQVQVAKKPAVSFVVDQNQ